MTATFDTPTAQLFNVFCVTQLAPQTFLAGVLGLDHVNIPANSTSEIHRHNQSDNVIYILRGTAILILDGSEHQISKGSRVCIPRGMYHGFRTSDEELHFISAQIPPILDKATGVFDREILSDGSRD